MARIVSFVVLVVITSILLVLFYQVISVFLLPLFLAAVTVIMLRPVHLRMTQWCRGRRYLAASIMTISVLLAVLIPFTAALMLAGHEAGQIVEDLDNGTLRSQLNQARQSLGLDYPFAEEFRFIESSLSQLRSDASQGATASGNLAALEHISTEFERLHEGVSAVPRELPAPDADRVRKSLQEAMTGIPGTLAYQKSVEAAIHSFLDYRQDMLGGPWWFPLRELANPTAQDLRTLTGQFFAATPGWVATFSGATSVIFARAVFGLMIFVVALFFWFADGPQIIDTLLLLSPLEGKYEQQLLTEFEVLVRAVVAGAVASAMAQAILSGIGFWFAGLKSIFLLTALTALMAMVPFVGASLVWIPVSLWLIFGEVRPVAGFMLALYGAGVVSTVDNLVRPWILLEKASLHPLAALVGVLGGVQALGPTGVFVGPIVVAFLQSLLMLLHREFAERENSEATLKEMTATENRPAS